MKPTVVFDGNKLAKTLKEDAQLKFNSYIVDTQIPPRIAMLSIGENAIAKKFLQCQSKNCKEIGIEVVDYIFSENTTEDELTQCLNQLNQDKRINAILIGLPLPKHLCRNSILNQISPFKDVDCCTSFNQGGLINGAQKFNSSCCLAVLRILEEMNISLQGKNALIIGSSLGKLIGLNLLTKNCTVTICNEFTHNITSYSKNADIVISVTGVAHLVKKEWLQPKCVLIDVGISHLPNGKIVGDVDFESVKNYVSYITPVPAGVGPVTSAMLLHNILAATMQQKSILTTQVFPFSL